ncbi:MAG TPA: hypothetical protein VFC03_09300 [Acidimicrobiales bacterium]|nr:hypothetical protein [Acidimicrobiales bacterium]
MGKAGDENERARGRCKSRCPLLVPAIGSPRRWVEGSTDALVVGAKSVIGL